MSAVRHALRRWADQRLAAWLRQRQGLDVLPLTLTARRIYIVPTRAGLGLGALLLAMLMAGLNYQNGLALLLCFTLAGVLLVAMVQCHQRLQGLRIDSLQLKPAFAGQTVHICAQLHLTVADTGEDLQAILRNTATAPVCATTLDSRQAQLVLLAPALQRGPWQMPALQLQTRAPFGLFRSWAWIHLPLQTLVYPAPGGSLPLPPGGSSGEGDSATEANGTDEWLGLRDHREADGLRQVDWKRWARGGSLQVRQFAGTAGGGRELDLSKVALPDLEARLSQLTAWMLQLHALGEPWLLRLPEAQIDTDQGAEHLACCLAALALHGNPVTAAPP